MPSTDFQIERRDVASTTKRHVVGFAGLLILTCSLFAHFTLGLWQIVGTHGDNPSYLHIAAGISNHHFIDLPPKFFWGLPYAVVALSTATGITNTAALYFISIAGFLSSTWLAAELWGEWTAVAFTAVNWMWLEFSSFGGAEPLFVALLFGSLLASRSRRFGVALLLSSLATTVRPLGIFAIAVVLLQLHREHGLRSAVFHLLIPLTIGLLYVTPLIAVFHDPLANVHAYQQQDWFGGLPVSLPFKAILQNYLNSRNVGNVFMKYAKLAFVAAHFLALITFAADKAVRRRAAEQSTATAFALSYSIFLTLYNSPIWALSIYPRLLVPVLPFFFWLYSSWIPQKWRVWGPVAACSVVLSCGAGLGYGRAIPLIRALHL